MLVVIILVFFNKKVCQALLCGCLNVLTILLFTNIPCGNVLSNCHLVAQKVLENYSNLHAQILDTVFPDVIPI